MNKSIITMATMFLSVVSCSAQKIQERNVPAFSSMKVSGGMNVNFTVSDTTGLEISAKGSDHEKIITKVENSVLVISSEGNLNGPVTVNVKNNRLRDLELSGAVEFRTTNTVKTDTIEFRVSGAGNVHAKLDAVYVVSKLSGASSLSLNGNAHAHDAELSGAATLKCYGLNTANSRVFATGASSAKVFVTHDVHANAGGASSIKIKGDPEFARTEASSAASIVRIKTSAGRSQANADTTTYKWKNRKLLVIVDEDEDAEPVELHDVSFKHWAGLMIGVNGYISQDMKFSLPASMDYMDLNYARSHNFQLNIFEPHFRIIKHNVKIVSGIGFDFHGYEFSKRTNLKADSSFTSGVLDTSAAMVYHKNRLRTTYIQVPLLLEFNTSNNPKKTFHVALGVVGQYLIGSSTRQKFEINDAISKRKRKDDYNLSPFLVKAHVNFGYRGWTMFGEYSLTSLFQPGKGPELYPFTAGIRLIPFG